MDEERQHGAVDAHGAAVGQLEVFGRRDPRLSGCALWCDAHRREDRPFPVRRHADGLVVDVNV